MRIPFTRYEIRRINPRLSQQYRACAEASEEMGRKSHARYHIINALLKTTQRTRYLEIGVRNPADNFDRIEAEFKVSVDPGVESLVNRATFPMTSDQFFEKWFAGTTKVDVKEFDVIFVDGLHLADQVYRDIQNALKVLAPVGYVVLHDCNPPTHFHAREDFAEQGPATHFWNGTTWKALQRFRCESNKRCFVVDVDWGVGVIVNHEVDQSGPLDATINPFYEFGVFAANRQKILNLVCVAEVPELKAIH